MISSIVVNYRTPADLRRFCASYDGAPGDELFIVNIDPRPEDRDLANGLAGDMGAHHLVLDGNVGYARGVNRGARYARGEVLAIFNADVELRPGALKACADRLMSDERWAVLGPLQVDRHGRCNHPGIFGTPRKPQWREGAWKKPVQPAWREVRDDAVTVMGSAYFIKASVWRELTTCPVYVDFCREREFVCEGAFLPTFLCFEETWASYHALSHGYRCVYDGTVEIVHDWHGAVKAHDKKAAFDRAMDESRQVFRAICERHGIEHD